MARQSLLEHPRLSEIEVKLNEARFDEAQRLLAALPDGPGADSARVYFATRILFERGRLDREGVIERLRELVRTSPDFPEALRMLSQAELGQLEPSAVQRSARPPVATERAIPPSSMNPPSTPLDAIPRAPLVPRFNVPAERPSYLPATQTPPSPRREEPDDAHHYDTELSPPPPPPSLPRPEVARSEPRDAVPDLDLVPPDLEPPTRPGVVPRIPSLEVPAQHEAFSTIPSPAPPPPSAPDTAPAPVPTLVDVAAALDRGEPAEALRLAGSLAETPELSLLKARALAKLGDLERVEAELGRLLRAPLLEPALRSAIARFLIELGFADRALVQARRALDEDPKDPMARVSCAWALVRSSQQTLDARASEEAEALLGTLRLRDPRLSALIPALRAWVTVERDASRALALAQTALGYDPDQPDALAALAFGSLKLGLVTDSERAFSRLGDVAPALGAVLEASLLQAGLRPRRAEPGAVFTEANVAALFGDAETALVYGRPELSVLGFERACADRLRALSRRGGMSGWPALAAAAARLFTELPVLRHFAPYDCSVFSVARLAAAFEVLYSASQSRLGDDATVLMAGAYLGESLRQAFGGEWHGTPEHPESAAVEAIGLSIRPLERIELALSQKEPLSVQQPTHLHPGADPLGNSVPLSLVPPSPWDPEPWPAVHRVAELGRSLPKSVVGLYCERQTGATLDHSVSSIGSIDRYITLLAPVKAPPALDAGWVRRAAVITGAYVGEVLVRAVGARWQEADVVNGASAYRLTLRDGTTTTPIARAFDRLSGRRPSPLSDYVARVVGGRPSMNP